TRPSGTRTSCRSQSYRSGELCHIVQWHAHVRFGSKADIQPQKRDVRFTPKSGHWLSVLGCPLCAKSGHWRPYSITSSATERNASAILSPIALPALRFTINSNRVGTSTGKSAGLVPLTILSDYEAS